MKLVNKVWVLGAVTAFGMGAAAEGCSSSSQGNGAGTGDADCVALEACCATLSGSNATMCASALGTGVDSTCASFLTQIKAANLCTGTTLPGGPDTGTTGTTPDTGTVTTGKDSGTGTSPDTGTTMGGMDAGTGADCEAPPTMVYAESKAGVYCPFSAVDGGKNQVCTAGEHCCETPEGSGASTCNAAGTACAVAMSTDWQCEGTPDCSGTSGTVCCGTGTIETQAACGTYPAYPYISKFTGSSCAASCTTYQICSQTSECPSGKTCVPVKPKGNTIGVCQ
jgi:hypothetical protein